MESADVFERVGGGKRTERRRWRIEHRHAAVRRYSSSNNSSCSSERERWRRQRRIILLPRMRNRGKEKSDRAHVSILFTIGGDVSIAGAAHRMLYTRTRIGTHTHRPHTYEPHRVHLMAWRARGSRQPSPLPQPTFTVPLFSVQRDTGAACSSFRVRVCVRRVRACMCIYNFIILFVVLRPRVPMCVCVYGV